MDPEHNPFSPGAGVPPPELAGRSEDLSQTKLVLARIKAGRKRRVFSWQTAFTVPLFEDFMKRTIPHFEISHRKKPND